MCDNQTMFLFFLLKRMKKIFEPDLDLKKSRVKKLNEPELFQYYDSFDASERILLRF